MIVYVATNTVNGKQYVGCTRKTLEYRWAEHVINANRGVPFALYRAIRKHGAAAFEVVEAHRVYDEEMLLLMESAFIAELNTFGGGYNMTPGGEGGLHVVTSEAKAKMRNSALLPHRRAANSMWASRMWENKTEVCAKIVLGNKRRFEDPEQRRQNAARIRAQWQDPAYRGPQLAKLAVARKLRWERYRASLS